jgi:hypothetical protein
VLYRSGVWYAALVIMRNGMWYVSTQRDGTVQNSFIFGTTGDVPLLGIFR